MVTPVEFGQLAKDGSSVAAAKRKVMPALTAHISQLPPQLRHRMREEPKAHLVELVVTRPASDDGQAIELPMGVVIAERQSRGKRTYIAYAPTVRQFSVSAKQLGDAMALATTRLGVQLGRMPAANAMACAETGEATLEIVDVEIADDDDEPTPAAQRPVPTQAESFVRDAGVELTAGTKRPPVAGVEVRESLVQRILSALATPERSSVVLVGRPDVGKTALIHEVANRMANNAVPPGLAGRPLWRLNANDLIAGAMFTGQWQGRGQAVIQVARATRAIFAMGEPGEIIDAGRHYRSDNNLSRLFRPYMEIGELSLLCECTVEAYGAARKQEPSFIDAFHRIDVPEPTASETHQILTHAARSLEVAQKVVIDPGATDAAIELTRRFEPYRGLPGKSVRLLEETVRSGAAANVGSIGRTEVVQTFAERSGMPLAILSDDVALRADDIADYLTARVLGQHEAIEAVVGVAMVVKAALYDSQKPLATMLFVGPTGVGKTELVKALAEYLFGSRDRVIRLDMAEFGTADAIQRLTGTTWTTEGESDLIRRIREQPFSVVLLDEIEKAHPSVYDALLGVTGEGRLTDARGRTADFRNAILVMTSNLGSVKGKSGALGFAADTTGSDETARINKRYVEQVEKFFRPEFFNRIDRVVVFRNLDRDTVLRIARRELGHLLLREGIVRRGLLVEFDEPVIESLAETGFHPRYGARPLQREIERAVIQPLAKVLVEANPSRGDLIHVRRQGRDVTLDLLRVEEAKTTSPSPKPAPAPAAQPASLTREAERAQKLLAKVVATISSEAGQYVQAQRSRIIVETSDPEFWDRPPAARESMAKLYLYQRLVDEMDLLRERAEGLAELGKQIRRAQNRDRLVELRKALTEVDASLRRLTLEINSARVEGGADSALVRIIPVGAGTERWAEELTKMYSAWADRSGREVVRQAEPGHSLIIRGPASVALLAGETGLHRRIDSVDRESLARVLVTPIAASDGAVATRTNSERARIVRIYDLSRRYVRDPRTGVQLKNPAAVLSEGKIDQFIIAMIGSKA